MIISPTYRNKTIKCASQSNWLKRLLLFSSLFIQPVFGFSQNNPSRNLPLQTGTQKDPDVESLLHYFEKQIHFTENKGQWEKEILYKAEFPQGKALVTRDGVVMRWFSEDDLARHSEQSMREEEAHRDGVPFTEDIAKVRSHAWMMKFLHGSEKMSIDARQKHGDQMSYFSGSGQASSVSSFQEVWYNNVYDQVDVRYYPSADGMLEYDIICKPGFKQDAIAIQLEGVSGLKLSDKGELIISTSVGEMRLPQPIVYQKVDGKQIDIPSKYKLDEKGILQFDLGEYNKRLPLVIDPIALRWATWVNSNSQVVGSGKNATSGDNHGHGIWVDPTDGAIYVVARVDGQTNEISVGALDNSSNGGIDLVVGKYLEPSSIGGSGTRVWQTYIGGSGDDNPYAMEMGPDGNLYITGYTGSSDFPLIGGSAFGNSGGLDQRSQKTDNTFILKINQAGTAIKAAVIGGDGDDGSFDLRLTTSGDVVVCGNTSSKNLATLYSSSGATNRTSGYTGNTDVHLFKINQALSSIVWMKNFGGTGASKDVSLDQATIMAMNPTNGDIFLGGYTTSSDFPVTSNARQNALGGTKSGFIQKIKSNGTTVWSSYFKSASSKSTSILCMEFNTLKNRLYFGGTTNGLDSPSNIPASGNYDNSYNSGDNDFFVASMDTNQTFVNSTYIGGSLNEVNMMGLNVDLNNDVYIFGYTNSTDFPLTSDALQSNLNNTSSNSGTPKNDKVFFKLPANLVASPLYSTYYGGSADDYDPVGERGIKFSNCRIYTIVTAQSNNIPLTQGALNTTKTSSTSIYEPGLVVWANPPDLLNNTISGSQTVCAGAQVTGLSGSAPSYSLATISRNGTTSSYPSGLTAASTYLWQSSTDSTNWTNISGGTTQNLSAALMGALYQKTYYRRIIGGDACVIAGAADQSVKVKVLSVPANITNVSCYGLNNGSITATPDGTAPYTYSWKRQGNNTVISTVATISNLQPGSYVITCTDASGCSASATHTVTQPSAALSATTGSTNATCGGSNGIATVTASGGTSPYTYLWSSGATTASASGLSAGPYSVVVTDANGCTFSANAIVSNTSNLSISTSGVTHVSCFGQSTGAFSALGANGTLPYEYSFNSGAYGSTHAFSNLATGTYTVSVKDGTGCIATAIVQINQPSAALSASITSQTNVTCGTLGSATVTAVGGTSPYTYAWSPSGGTLATASSLTPGNYQVQVRDAALCPAVTVNLSITNSDNNAPTWTSVAGSLNTSVSCSNASALATAQALAPVATDDCGNVTYTKTSGVFVAGSCGSTGTYTNTWIAKDAALNASGIFTQVITVTDAIAPTWTSIAESLNRTVDCNDAAALAAAQGLAPSATDNCGSVTYTKTSGSFVVGQCGLSGTYTNSWVAKDACNNTSTAFTQVISVIDALAPTWTTVAGALNQTISCSNTQAIAAAQLLSPVASDLCGTVSYVKSGGEFLAGACGGTYTTTWIAKDACNNESATFTQVITVTDDVVPTITTCSPNQTIASNASCKGIVPDFTTGIVASDNCTATNSLSISQSPLAGTLVSPGTHTITITVKDACGNTKTCTSNLIVSGPIAAVNDAGNSVNGYAGGVSLSDVLANDSLNCSLVNPAHVTLSFVSSTHAGITLNGSSVSVLAGTLAGTYSLTYSICDVQHPSNCDEATVSVPVSAAPIQANDDSGISVNGFTGGTANSNVLSNDKLNGITVIPAEVITSFVSASHAGITLSGSAVEVAPGTPAGSYSLVYRICEVLNPTNCDEATVSVSVSAASIAANNDAGSAVNGFLGGTSFVNILSNDQLNGSSVLPENVVITLVNASNPGISLSGSNVIVAAGTTAGNYTLNYRICELLNPSNCDEASVSVPVIAAPPVASKGEIAACYSSVNDAKNAAIAATQVTATNCSGEISKSASVVGTCSAEVTVTVNDECGNTGSVVYSTRIDNAAPTWTSAANSLNRSVACNDTAGLSAAQALSPVANDNCEGTISYTRTAGLFISGACGSTGTYTNSWTASDACGNVSSSFVQVIQIIDESAPTWTSTAGSLDRSVSCSNDDGITAAQALMPSATDNCGGTVNVTKTTGSYVALACGGTYTNTFVAKDECNNSSITFTQTITLTDDIAPIWFSQAGSLNAQVQCGNTAALTQAQSLAPTATDNCGTVTYTKTSGEFVAGSCGSTGSYTNTWIAKDNCSNESLVFTQVIQIIDEQAPTWTTSATALNTTVEAGNAQALATAQSQAPIASDVCTDVTYVKTPGAFTAGECSGSGSYTNTWIAKDACNNESAVFTQVILVGDQTGPSITECSPTQTINANAGCQALVPDFTSGIVANDNGSESSNLNIIQNPSAGTPVGPGTHTITITVTDACGNPSICHTSLVVNSVIAANDDAGNSVNGFIGGTSLANVLLNDQLNCALVESGDVTISFVSSTNSNIGLSGTSVVVSPGTPAGDYSLVYRICEVSNPTVCDEASVSVSVSAASIVANDDSGIPVNGYTGGTAVSNVLVNDQLNGSTVNAGDVVLTFLNASHAGITLSGSSVNVAAGTPAGNYTLSYRICEVMNPSNCDDADVSITVNHTAIVANDDAGASINGYEGGTAFSNVLSNDQLNGNNVNPSEITLSFVSSSNAGITLSGNNVVIAPGTPAGQYSLTYRICEILNPTNCDEAQVSGTITSAPIVANDDAGSTVNGFAGGTAFVNVLSNDRLNGTDVNPSEVTLSFVSSSIPAVSLSGLNVIVAPNTTSGTYSLTYRICEILNPSNCDEASVSIPVSAEAPVATKGSIESCYPNRAAAEAAAIEATTVAAGNCAGDVTKTASTEGTCTAVITVTVADNCGNSGIVSYETHIDGAEPVWSTAEDALNVTLACTDLQGLANAQNTAPVAFDLCENLSYHKTSGSFVAGSCGLSGSYTNTWYVSDDCGNTSSTFTQVITIADTQAPEWTSAANSLNRTISCTDHAGLTGAQALEPIAGDDCGGDVTITKTEGVFAPAACGGSYTNTFIAKDACGNESLAFTQVISIVDEEAPVWTSAAGSLNISIAYGDTSGLIAAQAMAPSASDNCDETVSYVKTSGVFEFASCGGTYTNRWTAKDDCNNSSATEFVQVITITDDVNPTWISEAGSLNVTVSCSNAQALITVQAMRPDVRDNVDAVDFEIHKFAGSFIASSCGGTYTNTFTTSDACGNQSDVFTQVITVTDDAAPTWTSAANALNRSVSCSNTSALNAAQVLQPIATDNCGSIILTKYPGEFVAAACGGTYTNTWIARDACNNASTVYTQVITITDNTAPTWVSAAGSLNRTMAVSNEQALILAQSLAPEASDLCSQVTYTKTAGTFAPTSCGGTYTNTWVAKDACNNSSTTFTQVITLTEQSAPIWVSAAGSLNRMVECGNTADLNAAQALAPIATDNNGSVTITKTTGAFSGAVCGGIYTNTWTAKDACNNVSAVFTQVITIYDYSNPIISNAGPNKTITCPTVAQFDAPTATDNCGTPSMVVISTVTCAPSIVTGIYTITRKWKAVDACGNSSGIRTQVITVNPMQSTVNQSICAGSSYTFYGQSYSQPGTYTKLTTNEQGCNLLAKLILTVRTPSIAASGINTSSPSVPSGASVALSVSGGMLGTDAVWKWYKGACGTGVYMGSGPSLIVSPTQNTTYFVRAEGPCGITSCVQKTIFVEPTGSCTVQEIVSFTQGKRKDMSNVLAARSVQSNCLGNPQYNDSQNAPINFLSLGFGGELIVKFPGPIANGAGNDLRIVETSFGNPSCGNYKERIRVSISQDGTNYSILGEGCLDTDFNFDAANMGWAQYVKITDISLRSDFPAADADGFDVDGVICLNGSAVFARLSNEEEPQELSQERGSSMKLFPNPNDGNVNVTLPAYKGKAQLRVFNTVGQLIASYPLNATDHPEASNFKLSLSLLPTGIYQVNFEAEGKAEALKFFKQ